MRSLITPILFHPKLIDIIGCTHNEVTTASASVRTLLRTMQQMIKGIVFDIGGVLAYDVWENMLLNDEKGLAVRCNLDREQVRQVGRDLWEIFSYQPEKSQGSWIELETDYWSLFVKRFDLNYSVKELIDLTDDFILPIKGMKALLENLETSGIDLAICSNNTEFWFHRQMTKLDLYKFFDSSKVIISSRVGSSKVSSDYRMFQCAISALRIDMSECLFIDDRTEAIMQAIQYGITAILFPSHSEFGSRYLTLLLQKMKVL